MTDLVDPNIIQEIVGRPRHPVAHLGRAVSEEGQVYILHSQWCKERTRDLRDCVYSRALDRGIDLALWADYEDQPVRLGLDPDHGLIPRKSVT